MVTLPLPGKNCPNCGAPLVQSDMTGVTYLWPDETPFDPQPDEWTCPSPDCTYGELRGLTEEQRTRLLAGEREVRRA